MLPVLVDICLVITLLLVGYMAYLFWHDPERGLRETTHRLEKLPSVMADRYTSIAALAVGVLLFGSLEMTAFFFAVCAFMGLADGAIYARAGHPHIKHTLSGVLGLVAMAITLAALATNGASS